MLSRNALLIFLGLMVTLLQCAYAQEKPAGQGDVAQRAGDPAAAAPPGGAEAKAGGADAAEDDKKNEINTDGEEDEKEKTEEGKESDKDNEVPTEGSKKNAGSGEDAAKQITEDVCLLAGTVKLDVPPIQAPCSVQQAMEVECQGRANFINPDDGSAVARGEQFMDVYKGCLFGEGSTYTQDAKACIKCREANKLVSTDEAGKLNKDLDESIEQFKNEPEINQTIQEVMEARAEKRGLPEPPTEVAERVVPLTEYYQNPPPVQRVGTSSVEGAKEEEPGKDGTETAKGGDEKNKAEGEGKKADGSGTDAKKEAGAGAGAQPEAAAKGGAPRAARLDKRQVVRIQRQITMMETAEFFCSTPESRGGFFKPVQFRQAQQAAPNNAPKQTTLITTVTQKTTVTQTETVTQQPAATPQAGQQVVSAVAFCPCRVIAQCKGKGVYVIAVTCEPPILMQNSALTPQKPIQKPQKKVADFSLCTVCNQKPVPVENVIQKPVAAVTSKCGEKVCQETTKNVQQAVTSDNLQPMVIFVQFSQDLEFQPNTECNICQGLLSAPVPQNRQPAQVAQVVQPPRPQQRPQQQAAQPAAAPARQGGSCR
ncbi:hypothetical protein CP533_3081 [Ophiocordyceps camponoti-saundersi (nom. inval.)]|nr:hypothetical protein CP533_3081 [Ophiocordyceps camponoti-saundersi (nom. inval.)]